jgi:hypothetical protein
VRKTLDRKASQEYPDAKRLLGALANSRGNRHEENTARLVKAALEMPREVGAALLATAEGYTPRATKLLDDAREHLGSIQEIAAALADDLPAPKTGPSRSRRRRRRKKKNGNGEATAAAATADGAVAAGEVPAEQPSVNGDAPAGAAQPAEAPRKRRRRRRPSQPAAAEPDSPDAAAG